MAQRGAVLVSFYSPCGDLAQQLLGTDVIPFHKRTGGHFSLGWHARIEGKRSTPNPHWPAR